MMGKIRRSMKSEKEAKPHHLSIPTKDQFAILPPKKVIKALYDYQSPDDSPSSGYLSFKQGDFLHVIDRENDQDWYEACNPLQGTRGLVPVKYFEGVGKQVRDSAGSTGSMPPSASGASHDSGYGESRSGSANNSATAFEQNGPNPVRRSQTAGKDTGATLSGIVLYDFPTKRPDELTTYVGQYITIVALSTPDWFIAKPIGQLGGPGLFPVSYTRLIDSQMRVIDDPAEAIRKAGLPSVEQWKRSAAEYKDGSIPLGRLEINSAQSLQQGVERMSQNVQLQQTQSNGFHHSRAPSSYSQQTSRPQQAPLCAVSASVPDFGFANDVFFFLIKCKMEDGRHWLLERTYQNFYDLQINLLHEFPAEAGKEDGVQRSLPYMPGPVTYVTENITFGRRANLDEYIKKLLQLGPNIVQGHLLREFFSPRGNDHLDPDIYRTEDGYRMSHGSHHSSHSDPSYSANAMMNHGQGQYTDNTDNPYQVKHQRAQSSFSGQQHLRTQSDLQVPPPMLRNNSALTQASASSAGSNMTSRIKVRFGPESAVIIKMQQPFSLGLLIDTLHRRRRQEIDDGDESELLIDYEDKATGEYRPIMNDRQLSEALDNNPNLKLRVITERSGSSWND